jgi:hypothetical protein
VQAGMGWGRNRKDHYQQTTFDDSDVYIAMLSELKTSNQEDVGLRSLGLLSNE